MTKNIPIIYPMNAKAVDPDRLQELWESKRYVAEEKFDGCRYLMYIDGKGKNRFFSRQKSVKTGLPVEKTENVPHLAYHDIPVKGLTILDGEIIASPTCSTSSSVVSIMGSEPQRAIELQGQEDSWVWYKVFDILYYNGVSLMNMPWLARRIKLEELFLMNKLPDHATTTMVCYGGKEEFYNSVIKSGGEGVILKNVEAVYQPDKRPADTWYKVKKYQTFDVVIMGFTPPKKEYEGKYPEDWPYWVKQDKPDSLSELISTHGRPRGEGWIPVTKFYAEGLIGAVRFGQYKDGKLVEIGQTSGMDEETRRRMSCYDTEIGGMDNCIGKVIEVGAMEQIKKTGALRHPRFIRFRPDKNPEDCIMEV